MPNQSNEVGGDSLQRTTVVEGRVTLVHCEALKAEEGEVALLSGVRVTENLRFRECRSQCRQ